MRCYGGPNLTRATRFRSSRRTAAGRTKVAWIGANSRGKSNLEEDKSRVKPGWFADENAQGLAKSHKRGAEPNIALVGILIKL